MPSIIVDSNTFVLIDGHNRLDILKEKGVVSGHILLINYLSESVILSENTKVTKNQIVNAGINNNLLELKNKHYFIDLNNIKRPLITLGVNINY